MIEIDGANQQGQTMPETTETAIKLAWHSVQFGPTKIESVSAVLFSQGGKLIEFVNDNNRSPVVIANNINRPHCSITATNLATVMEIVPGSSGAIRAVHREGIEWRLINAVHDGTDERMSFGQFAIATANFLAYASDGTTNPLSFTADERRDGGRHTTKVRTTSDALMISEALKQGHTLWDRANSILGIAEPMLAIDRAKGERAFIRRQGDGWLFVTKDPEDTVYHPLRTPLQRKPRYNWTDGTDGIRRGQLFRGE